MPRNLLPNIMSLALPKKLEIVAVVALFSGDEPVCQNVDFSSDIGEETPTPLHQE